MTASVGTAHWWLPGLDAARVANWYTLTFPDLEVRFPRLDAQALRAQIERIATARDDYLERLPVRRIVSILDRVATRWLEPGSAYRREAEQLLPLTTGYSEPAIRKGLASYLATLREENVLRLLEEELPEPGVLDGFVRRGRGGGETRAFGPRLTVHVWSGNVPGLPAQSLVSALLVKSASLGKVASEEPIFAALLAESIAEVDPRLAECLAVTYWPSDNEAVAAAAFGSAEAVIAYGGERAIEQIRARVPSGARFIPYGHKLSFGVIAREALASDRLADTVDRAAYDVVKFDQQGCLSPHLFYMEEGGDCSPRDFASALAVALGRYAPLVPRGRLTLEESAALATARHRFELRALSELSAGGNALVGADSHFASSSDLGPSVARESAALFEADSALVVLDPDPTFEPSCLNRAIYIKPVADVVEDVPRLAAPVRRYLQTCGVAASSARTRVLAERLGRLGLDRVCPLGRMGDVAPTWHHDGRFALLDLLRWTDLEPDATAGRWEFEHPDLGIYGRAPSRGEGDS